MSYSTDNLSTFQVRLREPGAFQLEDVKAISFAEVAERARALQVSLTPGKAIQETLEEELNLMSL